METVETTICCPGCGSSKIRIHAVEIWQRDRVFVVDSVNKLQEINYERPYKKDESYDSRELECLECRKGFSKSDEMDELLDKFFEKEKEDVRQITFDPGRASTVYCGTSVYLRDEVEEFKSAMKAFGIEVEIGRFDDGQRKVYDFRIQSIVTEEIVRKVAWYFKLKAFKFNQERSQIGAINLLKGWGMV